MALSLREGQWGQSRDYSLYVNLVVSVEWIFRSVCVPTEDRGNAYGCEGKARLRKTKRGAAFLMCWLRKQPVSVNSVV